MVILESISAGVLTELGKTIALELSKQYEKEENEKSIKKSKSYSVTVLDKVKTTNTKWTGKDKPLLSFENERKAESIVKEISVIPDTSFKTKGRMYIKINDTTVFRSESFGSFEDVSESVIEINKIIDKDSEIGIFMVSSDGTEVGATVQVTFGA